ncbi:MAG: GNAT family N-acetyltransferase, partial [Candidatus Sulfotelmatobacter sp.]
SKDDPKTILAYYTLSSRELKLEQLPPEIAKKAGKYRHLGVTLLGRLAVVEKSKGTGLGTLALMSALDRSLVAAKDVASWAVFVEAIDRNAASFYRKYGFIELPGDTLKLFLPMKTIAKSFSE